MEDLPTGKVEQVAPGVRRLLAPNPSPFTYTGTQTYLVGTGEVAVIDPGPGSARAMSTRMLAATAASGSPRSCAPTPTATTARPAGRSRRATGAPIVGCAPLALEDDGPRADAAFDFDYAPDRVLADGERLDGRGLDARRGGDAGPHLQPSLLRARRDRRAVHRRSCHGLVDHRRLAARRRHGRLYGEPRTCCCAATTASTPRARPGGGQAAAARSRA